MSKKKETPKYKIGDEVKYERDVVVKVEFKKVRKWKRIFGMDFKYHRKELEAETDTVMAIGIIDQVSERFSEYIGLSSWFEKDKNPSKFEYTFKYSDKRVNQNKIIGLIYEY